MATIIPERVATIAPECMATLAGIRTSESSSHTLPPEAPPFMLTCSNLVIAYLSENLLLPNIGEPLQRISLSFA
jgi:hypothetical protein